MCNRRRLASSTRKCEKVIGSLPEAISSCRQPNESMPLRRHCRITLCLFRREKCDEKTSIVISDRKVIGSLPEAISSCRQPNESMPLRRHCRITLCLFRREKCDEKTSIVI